MKWFRRVLPCVRNKQLITSSHENDKSANTNKIDSENEEPLSEINEECKSTEKSSEIEIFSEKFEQHVAVKTTSADEETGKDDATVNDCNLDRNQGNIETQLIACTLHECVNESVAGQLTHANVQTQSSAVSSNEKTRNTLVFKTIMVDGEPNTKKYKTVEPTVSKEIFPGEGDSEVCQEIKDSDVKIVFSYEVLEYLTKSFRPNCESALSGDQTTGNDLIICTLFPKQLKLSDEVEGNTQTDLTDNYELQRNDEMTSEMSDNVDVNDSNSNWSGISIPITATSASAQRSEYILKKNSPTKGFQTSMSKSSPHMQQQENNHNRETPRLRRNISKKVSWKENVEVCFINQSSRSANEILQEIQPLIDHEIYWKECVCERDRKRREKWLKIRADEQRCLTGDGQFHDYFAYRTHHFDDDEFRLIE